MKHQKKDNDFVYFVFEGNFRFTGGIKSVQKVFDEYVGQCAIYGIKPDGSRAMIDSKK